MFEPSKTPRFYGLPLGCDFLVELKRGISQRVSNLPPETLATVEIYVNTRRTARRLRELYTSDGATFLPRIKVITDLAKTPTMQISLPPPVSPLKRRLILAQLTRALLERVPDLAPASAAFDLADSLAALLDEMQGEGVAFDAIAKLDMADHSEHWKRSKQFLEIIAEYAADNSGTDPNDRLRRTADAFAEHWKSEPPAHPVIIAGSTGSRGETAAFMRAVANLPQGAVVLPGVDFDTPRAVWEQMSDSRVTLDHPQAGFHKLLKTIDLSPADLDAWIPVTPANPERNKLVSLALRPAPFTNQWLREGPDLKSKLHSATRNIDLIEASDPKQESLAIAVRLRKAAEDGQRAVLISPDRVLTRRVESTLLRWGIVPDDSAGQPLHLSAAGVFLRLVAETLGKPLEPQEFLALLKHPLAFSTIGLRGDHMLRTARIELAVLRGGGPTVEFEKIAQWAAGKKGDTDSILWANMLSKIFEGAETSDHRPLADWIDRHESMACELSSGANDGTSGALWDKSSGIEAAKTFATLRENAKFGGVLSATEYQTLFHHVLSDGEVREPRAAHPLISIWGTLEARVQGADLVVMGGLNDGIWPKTPTPDPWLNRSMRDQLGLLLPERNIGLSAHDFQQAIAAGDVVLSRAIRDGEAPTIASRWIVRFTNLINGLEDTANSPLDAMRQRGNYWTSLAKALDDPTDKDRLNNPRATRPAPSPPLSARPKKLFVTQIATLVRDPYSIYARYILGLKPLKDLRPDADALARGNAFHKIMEVYCKNAHPLTKTALLSTAQDVLLDTVPWATARALWLGKLESMSEWIINLEQGDREQRLSIATESKGEFRLDNLDFTLGAKADRLDVTSNGLVIVDYKTGKPPSAKEIAAFDQQLPLTALIAANNGFENIGAQHIDTIKYISFAEGGIEQDVPLVTKNGGDLVAESYTSLLALISAFNSLELGYVGRDRPQKLKYASDYDQLSRYGEWQDSDEPVLQVIK